MLINCKFCNTKSNVTEIQELKDIEEFTDRLLIIGQCRCCNKQIAMLVETRISDQKTFIDKFHDKKAIEVINREKKRLKNKTVESDTKFYKWVYGKNVEIKNKKGQVVQVRQYACDFRSGEKQLTKTLHSGFCVG